MAWGPHIHSAVVLMTYMKLVPKSVMLRGSDMLSSRTSQTAEAFRCESTTVAVTVYSPMT